MWRKNILEEDKFLVGWTFKNRKRVMTAGKRGEQYVHMWPGWRVRFGPRFYRVLPCNQRKMFWFYSKFSWMLPDRFLAWEWHDVLNSLSSLSWLLLCGIPLVALFVQCCSPSHVHAKLAALVCWSCNNKMPHTGWFRKVNHSSGGKEREINVSEGPEFSPSFW